MHFRPFRVLLALLIYLILTSVSPAPAATLSRHLSDTFQPGGHGFATAYKVSTATIAQLTDTRPETEPPTVTQSAPATTVPALQNVVRVPPPSGTNSSAKEGTDDNGAVHSDANGAGGTDNYLETVNRSFAIYSRSGALQYRTTYTQWFGSLASGISVIFDPIVIWDALAERFIFIADTGKALLLSVAQQSDATGNFCNYKFPTLTGLGSDFDKLGMNYYGVYFTTNELASNGTVQSNEVFFASRSQLESCAQKVSYTTWSNLNNADGTIAQAIVPALQYTSSGGNEYLVNSQPGGACLLTLWTLVSNSKPTLSRTFVPTQCYSPPPNARQAGSSATISIDDCSLTFVGYLNGLLTMSMVGSYDWGDGNGPVGIIQWFVLNPGTAQVSKQGAFGTPGYWLFYPAAITNFAGRMLFVYDASGPTIHPSIWYVNQTFTGTQALAQGVSYYGTSGIQPWGDYQSAWVDASGSASNAVWITGQYANATNSWGTKFALVTP